MCKLVLPTSFDKSEWTLQPLYKEVRDHDHLGILRRRDTLQNVVDIHCALLQKMGNLRRCSTTMCFFSSLKQSTDLLNSYNTDTTVHAEQDGFHGKVITIPLQAFYVLLQIKVGSGD